MLYVNKLSVESGMTNDPELCERIHGAIFSVLNLYQSSSNRLGL